MHIVLWMCEVLCLVVWLMRYFCEANIKSPLLVISLLIQIKEIKRVQPWNWRAIAHWSGHSWNACTFRSNHISWKLNKRNNLIDLAVSAFLYFYCFIFCQFGVCLVESVLHVWHKHLIYGSLLAGQHKGDNSDPNEAIHKHTHFIISYN